MNHTRKLKSSLPRTWLAAVGLIAADALAIATGYYVFRYGHAMPAILLSETKGHPDVASATDIYLLTGVFFVITRGILGDYSKRQFFWDEARATSSTLPLMAIPDILFVAFLGNSHLYPTLILSWLFLFPAIPLYRYGARYLMSKIGLWQIPTALVGAGPRSRNAYTGLRGALSLGFDVRFLILDSDCTTVPAELSQLTRINAEDSRNVAHMLQDRECDQVIVAAEDVGNDQIGNMIQRLLASDISVAIIPSLSGLPLFGMSTNYLFGRDILLLQLRNNLARFPSRIVKRVVDTVGPLIIIFLASPLWLPIMLAIKLDDGGPVFYVQRRVGRYGKLFPCIKFRTMAVDADARLARWQYEKPDLYAEFQHTYKLRDDPRITRVGKWLRRTSLDELPQLLNVLTGDMSMVGPRPVLEQELLDYYGSAAELYRRVRPGLTGLWQISGRSTTTYADRVSYDEWYILNWSLWYDAVILFYTLGIVCSGKGAF